MSATANRTNMVCFSVLAFVVLTSDYCHGVSIAIRLSISQSEPGFLAHLRHGRSEMAAEQQKLAIEQKWVENAGNTGDVTQTLD